MIPDWTNYTDMKTWKSDLTSAAYEAKKVTGLSLGQTYEKLSKDLGFKTYAALREAVKLHFKE